MPTKKAFVTKLSLYRELVIPDNKSYVDDVVRMYRNKKMVYSMAERTMKQLLGNNTQIRAAVNRTQEYSGKKSRSEIMKSNAQGDKPVRNWYVRGKLKLTTKYKNKHSDKTYSDIVPEAMTVRARSAEEAVAIFKDTAKKELNNAFYEYDQFIDD